MNNNFGVLRTRVYFGGPGRPSHGEKLLLWVGAKALPVEACHIYHDC